MAVLDINDIMKILPHRYPMLLVDKVLECDFENNRIVAVKNVTATEPFFQGHFPGLPIMPGVLQLEAMAQAGGLLLNQIMKAEGQVAYFMAIDKAKFRRVVIPGDIMQIEVVFNRARMRASRLHGKVTVDGQIASEADMMFTYRSSDD